MSQQSGPFAAPWPDGVIGRYLTVGGATVDVQGGSDHGVMTCLGCGEGYASFNERRTRELAQGHAERCRALPRPEATA
ncbi:hypothetical protein [Streptomyces sp. NPDC127038]|uniref:hypothetical protein n=1 Tax=Streptomyces sp. NPDC127038 TaxID=3347114 RepID=UPI00365B3755